MAEQVREHLTYIDVSSDFEDNYNNFSKLSEIAEGKTIIGFGEATHGTDEYNRAFKRLAQHLITHENFNVIVLAETNFSDTWALNQYVVYGIGDALTALQYRFHFSDTTQKKIDKEVVALADWIRDYNRSRSMEDRVWMLGAEALFAQGPARDALEYCRKNDIRLPDSTLNTLSELANLPRRFEYNYMDRNSLINVNRHLSPVYRLVASELPEATLKEQWQYQSIRTLKKTVATHYTLFLKGRPKIHIPRDSVMFENIRWISSVRPHAKILIKAHNSHLAKKGIYIAENPIMLGALLAQYYTNEYYTIGTDIYGGTYWTKHSKNALAISIKKRKIASVIEKSVNVSTGFINIHATPPLTDLFNKKLRLTIGTHSPECQAYFVKNFADAFDAVFYIHRSTPEQIITKNISTREFVLGLDSKSLMWEDARKAGRLKLSVNYQYDMGRQSLPGEGVHIEVAFFDSVGHFVELKTLQLPITETVAKGDIIIPPDAFRWGFRIAAVNVTELYLKEVVLNGLKIAMSSFQFYGNDTLYPGEDAEYFYKLVNNQKQVHIRSSPGEK